MLFQKHLATQPPPWREGPDPATQALLLGQQETLRRLTRVETRLVNLLKAHGLTPEGHTRQPTETCND